MGLCVLGILIWESHQWWSVGRFIESTDDAYVRADIVTYSAEVSGTVKDIPVKDNVWVKEGDQLVRHGNTAYQAKVAQA